MPDIIDRITININPKKPTAITNESILVDKLLSFIACGMPFNYINTLIRS